jgi:1-acyl-sn-glycerol-3-phosphate acyltransferase
MAAATYSLTASLYAAARTITTSIATLRSAQRGRLTVTDCNDRLSRWATDVVAHSQMHINVVGRHHFADGEAFVVMSNHQSHYDIPVLYWSLGGNMRMVAKRELERIPFFGAAARAAGCVFIERTDRDSAIAGLNSMKSQLAAGMSVYIAPEGTRSVSGQLQPFKKGGFVLAQQMNLRILPVTLQQTREVLRPSHLRTRLGCSISVIVHPPIAAPVADTARAARDAWMAEVHAAIAAPLITAA